MATILPPPINPWQQLTQQYTQSMGQTNQNALMVAQLLQKKRQDDLQALLSGLQMQKLVGDIAKTQEAENREKKFRSELERGMAPPPDYMGEEDVLPKQAIEEPSFGGNFNMQKIAAKYATPEAVMRWGGEQKENYVSMGTEGVLEKSTGKVTPSGLPRKPDKVPSLGNAAEIAISRHFKDSTYLTDPGKFREAATWLATVEGSAALKKATLEGTPQSITYIQTAEGYTPAVTRGPGIGTVGETTGLKKPIPAEETRRIGDLNTLLKDIATTRKLYNPDWVGPIAGRVGKVEEKYTGTALTDQVKFYAYVRDMKDALLRARSGAQINEQEYNRLVSFLPDEYLPSKSFEARLDRFEAELKNVLESKREALKEGGYGPKSKPGVTPPAKTEDRLPSKEWVKGLYNSPNSLDTPTIKRMLENRGIDPELYKDVLK